MLIMVIAIIIISKYLTAAQRYELPCTYFFYYNHLLV